MAIFTLTITSRTPFFGDRTDQERSAVAYLLHQAANQLGQGAPPLGGSSLGEPGAANPSNCSWTFGAGALNQGL